MDGWEFQFPCSEVAKDFDGLAVAGQQLNKALTDASEKGKWLLYSKQTLCAFDQANLWPNLDCVACWLMLISIFNALIMLIFWLDTRILVCWVRDNV